jgi:hypothetical protein
MTVEQNNPLPSRANRPPASLPWLAPKPASNRGSGEGADAEKPSDWEPVAKLTGWPRIFPGL